MMSWCTQSIPLGGKCTDPVEDSMHRGGGGGVEWRGEGGGEKR